jgi:hypothetical protein
MTSFGLGIILVALETQCTFALVSSLTDVLNPLRGVEESEKYIRCIHDYSGAYSLWMNKSLARLHYLYRISIVLIY